jgi:hypothetical protein
MIKGISIRPLDKRRVRSLSKCYCDQCSHYIQRFRGRILFFLNDGSGFCTHVTFEDDEFKKDNKALNDQGECEGT